MMWGHLLDRRASQQIRNDRIEFGKKFLESPILELEVDDNRILDLFWRSNQLLAAVQIDRQSEGVDIGF